MGVGQKILLKNMLNFQKKILRKRKPPWADHIFM
jgi:hypothetical protein